MDGTYILQYLKLVDAITCPHLGFQHLCFRQNSINIRLFQCCDANAVTNMPSTKNGCALACKQDVYFKQLLIKNPLKDISQEDSYVYLVDLPGTWRRIWQGPWESI